MGRLAAARRNYLGVRNVRCLLPPRMRLSVTAMEKTGPQIHCGGDREVP